MGWYVMGCWMCFVSQSQDIIIIIIIIIIINIIIIIIIIIISFFAGYLCSYSWDKLCP